MHIPNNLSARDQQNNLEVIDALRGYAILLVVTVHSLQYVPDLVWPVKRLFSLGFYGVQLFFIASAITLLMSWNRTADPFGKRIAKFLLRRFFRIAPFYYLAILIYWFAYQVQPTDFNSDILLASLLFYNAWSPYLIPTVPGWTPVPGGWSIGVEFCFYFLFPLLATAFYNLKRAFVFFIFALSILIFGYICGKNFYQNIPNEALDNFLYFWPPNHLVVFALGFILYHLLRNEWILKKITIINFNGDSATFILLLGLIFISFFGVRKFFDFETFAPPTHLVVSVLFIPWMLFFILKPGQIFINQAVVGLGKVSFSAYILHFAILRYANHVLSLFWPLEISGMLSVLYELVLLLIALSITRWAAGFSYQFVELPFMRFGKRLGENLFLSR